MSIDYLYKGFEVELFTGSLNAHIGVSDDIEKASKLIYQYCCVWGMNKKIGPLNVEAMNRHIKVKLLGTLYARIAIVA